MCIVNLADDSAKVHRPQSISTCRLIDASHNSTRLISIPVRARCHVSAVASVGSVIFVMGSAMSSTAVASAGNGTGSSSSRASLSRAHDAAYWNCRHLLERFDTESRTWEALPSFKARQEYCATFAEGCIYVCGGRDSSDCEVDKCQRFNCEAKIWERLPPMGQKRAEAAAVCLLDAVVVIGGFSDGCALTSVECFSSSSGKWQQLPQMTVARSKFAAVVHQGILYVLGGEDSSGAALRSVERFLPMAGTWEVLPSLSHGRARPGAACVGCQIFALGPDSAPVEVLDLDRVDDGWILGPQMP